MVCMLASENKTQLTKGKLNSRKQTWNVPRSSRRGWIRVNKKKFLAQDGFLQLSGLCFLVIVAGSLWSSCLVLNYPRYPTFLWGKSVCSGPAESYNAQEGVMWDKRYGNNLALLTSSFKIFDTSDLISGILSFLFILITK